MIPAAQLAALKAAADEWQDTYPSDSEAAQDAAGGMYTAVYVLLAAAAPQEEVRAA